MPCTGQNLATHASRTTKNFFVSVSFPGSFKLFSKSVLHIFFLHYLWLIQVPVLAQRERTGSSMCVRACVRACVRVCVQWKIFSTQIPFILLKLKGLVTGVGIIRLNVKKTKEMLTDFRKAPTVIPDLFIDGMKVESDCMSTNM